MTINQNTAPYWNDFDEFKNFHQVLFRPGYAVQARELTQLQSILKNQVTKFGNHVFKHGSVVIPGNTFGELAVPCIKIAATNPFDNSSTVVANFLGQTITLSGGSGAKVTAIVKAVYAADGTNPDTLYLNYISGDGASGNTKFQAGQALEIVGASSTRCTVTGVASGSMVHINAGVYYINGTFVSIDQQNVITSLYDGLPSCHVLLKITEEIVTNVTDETLLDPAQGSYNFAAPGADRLHVTLTLTTLPLNATFSEDYVELMRYNQGVLEINNRYPKYNELEKSLARRTYDEAGDYIVGGFGVNVREHLKQKNNGGVYDVASGGLSSKIVYDVAGGRGYINGFEIESLTGTRFETYKARKADTTGMTQDQINAVSWTNAHELQDTVTNTIRYGQYLMVTNLNKSFDIEGRAAVNLYDMNSTSGTVIGTANILAFDQHIGDGLSSATTIWRAYLYNIKMTSKSIAEIGLIAAQSDTTINATVVAEYGVQVTGTFSNTNVVTVAGTARATVALYSAVTSKIYLYKHVAAQLLPIIGDTIVYSTTGTGVITSKNMLVSIGQNSMLFPLPYSGTSTLKNSLNLYDLQETVFRKLTITSGQTTSNLLASGTILPLEAGNFVAIGASGVSPFSSFTLNGNATGVSISAAGLNIAGTGPYTASGGNIDVYVQVKKTSMAPRAKTKTIVTNESQTAAAIVTLANTDIIAITSITATGVDVTNRYALFGGQTDYTYGAGTLTIKNGYTVPSGSLLISYTYFAHGAGDFFTADSYTSLGANYLDQIPTYISSVDGSQYPLRDCIDYRASTGSTGNSIVIDSVLSTSFRRNIPRTDIIAVDKSGDIKLFTGMPSLQATPPIVPDGYHAIQMLYIPAYTDHLTDIQSQRVATVRSTMRDISNIGDRISRLEDYTTLTALESKSIQINMVDAKTGLNRFKTGYLTEDMSTPLEIADALNAAFAAGWDNNGMVAAYEVQSSALLLNSSTVSNVINYNKDGSNGAVNTVGGYALHNGGFITLAYTEEVFASQPLSSRVTNINPFLVMSWQGQMKLYPNGDTWFEQVDRPDIYNTVNSSQVEVHTTMLPPDPAPTPVATVAATTTAGPVTVTASTTVGANNTGSVTTAAVVVNNTGSGNVFVNIGSGTQNNNTGSTESNAVLKSLAISSWQDKVAEAQAALITATARLAIPFGGGNASAVATAAANLATAQRNLTQAQNLS